MRKHEKIYTVCLILFIFCEITAIGTFSYTANQILQDGGENAVFTADVLHYVAYICGCFAVFGTLTLILRYWKPEIGRHVTKALNILILIYFPLGTVLGIYGLLKVDKKAV